MTTIYIKTDEILEDDTVQHYIEKLDLPNDKKTDLLLLVNRISEVANSHIWGLLMSIEQERDSQ